MLLYTDGEVNCSRINLPKPVCWKSRSTWKPQTIATRYINSTQSPSATEDTGRNLFSHILPQQVFSHNKVLQWHFWVVFTSEKKILASRVHGWFWQAARNKCISTWMHTEFYTMITNPRHWSTIKRSWYQNHSVAFPSIQPVTSDVCVQCWGTCSLPVQHRALVLFSSWSCSCWWVWAPMIKCKMNKTNFCGPCYILQMI